MVTLSTQAEIAIRSLLPVDRELVKHRIALLEGFPIDATVKEQAKLLAGPNANDLYIIQATPQLRILFHYAGDGVEVVDVMPNDRLERLRRHAA